MGNTDTSTFANVRYNERAFGDFLEELKKQKKELDDLAGSIRNIVTTKLLEHGITGTTAETLLSAFDIQVISYIENFSSDLQTVIDQNTHVKDSNDSTAKKVATIANSI